MNVITFGESMLRLTPPAQQLIEQSSTFNVHIGGSESNVAVGLARLGWRVAWVSRMTDNPLGHSIVNAIRAHGVDVSSVVWTDQDRVGVYYLEEGNLPRGSRVTYDRAGSAMSCIQPQDFPASLFDSHRPGWFHLSGITLAISPSAAQTALYAAQQAKNAGWRISFDVNYRAMLWSVAAAKDGCEPLLKLADVVFVALRDAVLLYDAPQDSTAAIRHIQRHNPQSVTVMTCGADGAVGINRQGEVSIQSAFPAEGNGRIGGGDAFAAGFLSDYMETQDVSSALAWGSAAAAYKYTLPGDMPLLDQNRLHALLQQHSPSTLLR